MTRRKDEPMTYKGETLADVLEDVAASKAESEAKAGGEDYRIKNAREGKALYTSGKTLEGWKAEQWDRLQARGQVVSCTINLPEGDWSTVDVGLPDVLELLEDMCCVLSEMSYLEDLDQPWVNSSLRLAGRGARAFIENEGRALDRLDAAIRTARKEARP